ncbi:adenine nucleotide alpha hydrolase [Aureimonas fodinaquatilis]|uniref:Adenine nucleotide alpha hydrolase n=1 Tax=Aureimonas fodinaquatilis TaxID=2565783 RepID=A0A5B0DWJ3_9HYPH|nr:adenine nucleotide alpha hydrolase [Aureimonas fodinaquatilis]
MVAALQRLETALAAHPPLAIAVSGGVDSMTLAFLAHRISDVEMIHASSPAVPAEATARVEAYANRFGWKLTVARAREFEDPDYLANPVNRCFFCKSNLYQRISELSPRKIASGANLDDLGDYRPGLLAAAERQVVHPLIEAQINKQMVRELARAERLDDLAELAAQPCLSSRIETGIGINADDLAFVHMVESAVRQIGGAPADVRCRITRNGVVLELEAESSERVVHEATALASRLAADSGRQWSMTRPYQRGSAFLHSRP